MFDSEVATYSCNTVTLCVTHYIHLVYSVTQVLLQAKLALYSVVYCKMGHALSYI